MKTSGFTALLCAFVFAGAASIAQAQTFSNPSTITINDAAPATPYPSSIAVSGVTSSSNKVTVTLNGFSHTFSSDLNIVVVAPNGQAVALINRVGGGADYTGGNYSFNDAAASPVAGSPIAPGTYLPSGGSWNLPAPGPASPYGSSLDATGSNVNGTWSLYVADQAGADVGQIAGGWTLNFTPNQTCASEGYTGTQLIWCRNICEMGYTGATLNVWIRRWIERYRQLPYCALPNDT